MKLFHTISCCASDICVLQVKPVSPGVVGYYLRQGEGRWAGRGSALLGLEGAVERHDLSAVLSGRHPRTGRSLPEVRRSRRRAGWDLVLSAPKSLSLLCASDSYGQRIADSHRSAAGDALRHFEDALLGMRRAAIPGGRASAAGGAVAASFAHKVNAGGEPHLHSHVLVMNLARDGEGRWWSLAPWWLERRGIDAVYTLALRHHLHAAGVDLDWHRRPDGLLDVAGVPRAAMRATSTRAHEVAAGARFSGRSSDPHRPWRQRAQAAGWEPSARVARPVRTEQVGGEDLERNVTAQLALGGSTFGRRDVLVALATIPRARFDGEGARRWTDEFLGRCTLVADRPVPLWTSELARNFDLRLESAVRDRVAQHERRRDISRPFAVALAADRSAERLLGAEPVVILSAAPGRSEFVAHTTLARECAPAWASSGLTVGVAARSAADAGRWTALTGIERAGGRVRPDVLIVDQADRMTSAELEVILDSARSAKIVLVEGGTSLRLTRPRSRAFESLCTSVPRLEPGVPRAWDCSAEPGSHPAHRLLEQWAAHLERPLATPLATSSARPPASPPTILVGLGVPEAAGLAEAARRHLETRGLLTGPALQAQRRAFRAGDTVLTVRAVAQGVPAGTLGLVTRVDERAKSATIQWPARETITERATFARIVHGYAATPRLAGRTDAHAFVLGDPSAAGIEHNRVLAWCSERRFNGLEVAREAGRDYGPDTWPVHR